MHVWNLLFASLLGLWLLIVAMVDLRTFRIPDTLSLTLLGLGLVFAAWRSQYDLATHLLGAAAGYLSLALFGEAFFRLRGREGLGLGDAKLFGAAGAWLGWPALPFVLLLASVSGVLWALVAERGWRSDRRLAFGPHIAAGFWLVWVFGAPGLPPAWR